MGDRGKPEALRSPVSLNVDLDRLSRLAHDDPDAFERERQRLIEACIASSPVEDRAMLRRLQFRADGTRRRSCTPLQSSLRLAEMMWTSFYAMNERLNRAVGLSDTADEPKPCRCATVLTLRPTRGSQGGD